MTLSTRYAAGVSSPLVGGRASGAGAELTRIYLAGAQVDLVVQSGCLERLLDRDECGRLGRPALQVPRGVQPVRGSLRHRERHDHLEGDGVTGDLRFRSR